MTVDPQPEGQGPVKGYTKQSDENVALVNDSKELENRVGDLVQAIAASGADPRMVAIAITQLQDGFMWLNRSVFQPKSRLGPIPR